MKIAITVDLESDLGMGSYYGLKIGLPKILEIFDKENIRGTFFITGNIIDKFPSLIKKLSKNHEIGMHGTYNHRRLNKYSQKIKNDIIEIKEKIERITEKPICGFRAPFLDIDVKLLKDLKNLGFKYDSSLGSYRARHNRISKYVDEAFEFKVLFPNVFFRFPFGYYVFNFLYQLNPSEIMIFYLHPWEAMNMRSFLNKFHPELPFYKKIMRIDRWFNTGEIYIKRLHKFIMKLQKENVKIGPIRDFIL
ncbi:MAG: polysaccharide deacetylase family protein [Candidatus Lokiarchaeota archaeon]|nr:polysaccharide deacetylase family protein [Candidatus Lokiarchaeota archaeon]